MNTTKLPSILDSNYNEPAIIISTEKSPKDFEEIAETIAKETKKRVLDTLNEAKSFIENTKKTKSTLKYVSINFFANLSPQSDAIIKFNRKNIGNEVWESHEDVIIMQDIQYYNCTTCNGTGIFRTRKCDKCLSVPGHLKLKPVVKGVVKLDQHGTVPCDYEVIYPHGQNFLEYMDTVLSLLQVEHKVICQKGVCILEIFGEEYRFFDFFVPEITLDKISTILSVTDVGVTFTYKYESRPRITEEGKEHLTLEYSVLAFKWFDC